MANQKYAEDIEDDMQCDDEYARKIYEKCAYVEDKPCGYGPEDDSNIYYMGDQILLYEGPNLVAQVVKNHLGQTMRTILDNPEASMHLLNEHDLDHQQNTATNHHHDDHHHQEMNVNYNHNINDDDQEEQEQGDGRGILFIEKALRSTDVSDHHHRLSVSCKQAVNDTFLTDEELENMIKNRGAVKAVLTDPAGREYEVRLQIEKTGTGNCLCYKIPKPWNQIRKENHIKEGMVIQLWASRPNNGSSNLRFHLVCLT